MPLHGKIVVIKRSGGDGTEFPLTASCLFGRKPDCDIRIQLPQVSKDHCRIDLNENKEVVLTNLSSVNPTRINGEVMKQAQRLTHGDVITIIDRSFRFEYPPEPTPKKKRHSLAGKSETLQVADPGALVTGERKKSSELISDSCCLKDGTNTSHVQAIEDCEETTKEADQTGLEQRKPNDKESRSPFCELYEMIKQNLNMKSPWKPAEAAQSKTLHSRREPQKTAEVNAAAEETGGDESASRDDPSTPLPKKTTEQKRRSSVGCVEQMDGERTESTLGGEATPKSAKRKSKVSAVPSLAVSVVSVLPAEGQVEDSFQSVATPSKATPKKNRRSLQTPAKQSVPEEMGAPTPQKKPQHGSPQKFSASEVASQVVAENSVTEETVQSAENSETPKGRRSKGSTVVPCEISAGTPGTPSRSHSSDGDEVLELKEAQCESEAEMSAAVQNEKSPKPKEAASPRRVSPRKSPGKKLQASDVLLEIGLPAPPSGGKSVKAGTPKTSGKKRKSGELESDLPGPQLKRKRVSFGGQLSPELFDRRLPSDSPLRKGATPGRRSLSVLRQSVLQGSFTTSLMEELCAEVSSPKSKTPQCSPGKKASPKHATSITGNSSPAKKSPKTKAKTPSPKITEVRSSLDKKSPAKTSSRGKLSPSTEDPMVPKGRKSPSPSGKAPQAPSSGKTPIKQLKGTPRKKSPTTSTTTPPEPVLAETGSPSSTPVTSARRGRSFSDALNMMSPGQSAAEMSKSPLPAQKASVSTAKTPSSKGLSNQTPSVKGRFSVSRISTPSPVADEDTGAMELSACVTPRVPLRRKSMKSTSKRTPKSTRKSVLEVIRSRRSGASRANLKVVSSWADIVKFGVSKPQTGTTTKKCIRKATTVKKTVVKKLKTPAKKIKEHFSTGHAASPATIVVGKAHTKVAQTTGCAPKIVHNIALLRKNMNINEDLSGIAEIFRTPANETSGSFCPETPQAAATSFTESSVIDTPEEMGEMVVSPFSVIGTEKCGMYDSEAIAWLLQEDQDSSLNGDDAPEESDALMTPLVTDVPEQDPVPKRAMRTPKQKAEPLMCLTGVKRLLKTPKQKVQQGEDLRGIKRLLKTPKEPKVSQELSLVGVKEIMKTPKLTTTPLVCTTSVKRLMRTPKQKGEPVEDMIEVKRLMQTPEQKVGFVEDLTAVKKLKTPKQKVESVEDLTGVKQLETPKQKVESVEDLTAAKQLKTPKQKVESVEDLTGVKQLEMPKQKVESVEDLTGLKQLETPKQKVESVEDLTAAKQLKTPKQKVESVEDLTAVKQLKTPKQKVESVEDLTGVKQLETPKQKVESVEDLTAAKQLKTPKQKVESVEDLTAAKQLKTPKQKVESVEDLTAAKQLKTPKKKVESVEDLTGVKQLETPKQKVESVEDLTAAKQLKTPKQKVESVEDLTGVKQLETPKQKVESVEHLTAVKQLKTPKKNVESVEDLTAAKQLKTPKQKVASVEHLTGVKQLMKTPKQKGQPVENYFGISKLMKSPRQRCVAVEDFTGLQELMEEPSDYLPSEVCETSAEKISEDDAPPEFEKGVPGLGDAEMASKEESIAQMHEENYNATKKSVRGRRQKQVETIVDSKISDPANPQSDAETNSAGDARQNLPEVKPKRGRQARPVVASVIKRTRQKITEMKEEVINSVVAAPTKSTRGKGARNVKQSEEAVVEEKLCENVESVKKGGDEVKNSDIEIAEQPAVDLVPARGRRGKKTREIPQNDTSPTEMKEDSINSVVAAPTKSTRGKRARNVDESEKGPIEEKLCENVESVKEGGDEVKNSDMEITEQPNLNLVPARGRRGKKTKEIPQNSDSPTKIKDEPIHSIVAAPTRSTKRKGAKNVEESEKGSIEEKLCENVESKDEVKNSDMEIAEQPNLNLVPARGRRGKKTKEIPQNSDSPTKIKDEPIHSIVAAPTRSTKRKGAKNVEESEKGSIEEKLCENVESKDEVKNSDMEIAEQPALDPVPARGRRGKKTKEIPQNGTSPAPVKTIARGKKSKLTDGSNESTKVECIKMSPDPEKVEDSPETMPAPVPIMKPRRGRKPKQVDSEGYITVTQTTEGIVCDTERSDVGHSFAESKEEAPGIKSGRGRKAKAAVKEDQTSHEVLPKRTRRGAVDKVALQTVASPAPSLKSGRGRKAQNLESTEEMIPVHADVSSADSSTKPPKKVSGTRRQANISDTVDLDVISPAPLDGDCIPDTSLSKDLVKNGREQAASTRRKAVSRKAAVSEPDELEIETSVKNVKRAPAKKYVNWSSDLGMSRNTEIGVLPSTEEGPQQRLLAINEKSTAGFAENADNKDETRANLEQQSNPRRGRAGKKSTVQPTESAPVTEPCGPEPCTGKAQSTRKGKTQAVKPKSDPVKDDVPIAKGGTKRKLTQKGKDEVTGDNESVSLDSLPKRARGRMTKVEETKIEDNQTNKTKRGSTKKSGKTLDNKAEETEPIVETPKPARRGRRKLVQQDEVEPVPVQEECPPKRKMESAKQTATRGRAKTEKKVDCTQSAEAKPVRRTRQK